MAILLSGKELARTIRGKLVECLNKEKATPVLAAVMFGNDEGSLLYAQSKARTAERTGIKVDIIRLPGESSPSEALSRMSKIASDDRYCGIIVEEPIPEGLDSKRIRAAVPPEKDVDCATAENLGRILLSDILFTPATPQAVLEILKNYDIKTESKRVVIVGRSRTVGLPLANMMLRKSPGGNSTVTVCHSRTEDLPAITRGAEILIVAAGRPGLIGAEHVSGGAVVVDVGTNFVNSKLVGDVDFEAVEPLASAITPVPGGVGPVTVACLLRNVSRAFRLTARD